MEYSTGPFREKNRREKEAQSKHMKRANRLQGCKRQEEKTTAQAEIGGSKVWWQLAMAVPEEGHRVIEP